MTLSYSIVDLDSARHDGADTPFSRIVICSSPRTGSYLLCEAMRLIGAGVPHEYFNPPTMRVLTARWGLAMPERVRAPAWWRLHRRGADRRNLAALSAYLSAIQNKRSRNAIFAAKIQYWQYERLLDNLPGRAFLFGSRFIHLHREDVLGQAISLRLAETTGRWGVDGVATTRARRGTLTDVAALDRAVETIRAEEAGWRGFFARNGVKPASLSYESMRDDPLGAARLLVGNLLGPDAIPGLPSVAQPSADDAADLKKAMREAYLAARPLPEGEHAQHRAHGAKP
jgi:LPS sulfotransferase NodH